MNALQTLLGEASVVVCVGSGGVGKTTISSALALMGAQIGKDTLVCTIDPAKRLANSLGLSSLGNSETVLDRQLLLDAQLQPPGSLHAMMLDMKQTWDDLISRYASPETKAKIFANRFYQSLSTALAGSQEYVAMEKLWELHSAQRYQLIVLDTPPPTAHALDFLDAPKRILDFLDNDAARFLLTPALAAGKVGLQLFSLGSSYLAKTLARFTGVETLRELAGFLLAISGLNEGFRGRAREVSALLASEKTRFVLVTSPVPERIEEALHFYRVLQDHRLRVGAVLVNRVHAAPTEEERRAAREVPSPLGQKLEETLDEMSRLSAQDEAGIARLSEVVAPTPLLRVPRFDRDVHDLKGLAVALQYLMGERQM